MTKLARLFRPRTIAVIGGGTWGANVIDQCRGIGFDGDIWPVHPTRTEVGGLPAYSGLDALPGAPDAVFIGVNRDATIALVSQLAAMGAGGAVCFASGFSEAAAEMLDGSGKQAELIAAAGDMPILGPNCYGFVNALDGAALWPDLHGMTRCARGVAIVTQSSNLSINLSMQTRGLPVAYMVTVGNQAQTGMAQIGQALLDDPRVTALGLHIEGIGDLPAFLDLAARARALHKPVVVLKVGASDQAQAAMVSHTASLAGSDAGARALFQRLGFGQAPTPAIFAETLKLLHVTGGLPSARIASMSCSGGEASLMADLGQLAGVSYPPLEETQRDALRAALGPKVALANPLDYHTYIWGNTEALTRCFSAMMLGDLALGCVVLDFPRMDRFETREWGQVLSALVATREATQAPMALIASLPENMPERVAQDAITRGIVPFCGMAEALAAITIAADLTRPRAHHEVLLPAEPLGEITLSEAEAKAALAAHGLRVPGARRVAGAEAAAEVAFTLGVPVVLKGEGVAHKTEAGAVAVGLGSAELVAKAARAMPAQTFLVEEMITGAVAELLVGVLRDPAHGYVLTLGAGGVLTELMADTTSLMLPATRAELHDALMSLRTARLLSGYRGKPGADIDAILDAIEAVQAYVHTTRAEVLEVELNPLMALEKGAVAVDALIRKGDPA